MPSYNHFGCSCCGGPFNGGKCPSCSSVGFRNKFVYDPNPYSYNETPNFFNQPPQHQYETYSCELCGGNSHPGFDYQPGNTPVFDQGPCYNQDFGFNQPLHYSPSQPQQFPCENCGVLHENFQCQPLNQNFYEPNHGYNSNFSDFDQLQLPQFPVIHHPLQATDTEMLQARENLMETIQAFLNEYDHIPPKDKCMALLMAEERFLKIKQAMKEEQNQPEIKALNLTPSIPFVLEYPSSSPIPVVDSDFLIKEVDTFLVPEDLIPPGIESDFDSEGDIIFLDNLLNDDPILEYERFTFDIEPDAPDYLDFEDSRAHDFVHSYIRSSYPQLHLENPISKSYRLTFIFSILNKRLLDLRRDPFISRLCIEISMGESHIEDNV
ncbi:hypothetical protein Tco_1300583 [Tanacetum coccineum]